jgi:hypothetical protein
LGSEAVAKTERVAGIVVHRKVKSKFISILMIIGLALTVHQHSVLELKFLINSLYLSSLCLTHVETHTMRTSGTCIEFLALNVILGWLVRIYNASHHFGLLYNKHKKRRLTKMLVLEFKVEWRLICKSFSANCPEQSNYIVICKLLLNYA